MSPAQIEPVQTRTAATALSFGIMLNSCGCPQERYARSWPGPRRHIVCNCVALMNERLRIGRLPVDPVDSAKEAGLRYVRDVRPGIRRVRAGAGWRYLRPDGRPIRSARERKRIESLVIPPAWTDVWICPIASGHLQATGRDDRGRKQ